MSSEIKIDKKNIEEFFNSNLKNSDPDIYNSIQKEFSRQQNHIELIASENIVSRAVLEAQGSVLTNKYAEGYLFNNIDFKYHIYLFASNNN